MMCKSLMQFLALIQLLVYEKIQFKKWPVDIFVKCNYFEYKRSFEHFDTASDRLNQLILKDE